MNTQTELEILLVEDNPRDAEMTLRTLKKRHVANHIRHVKDGQEALDWLQGAGVHANRDPNRLPQLVLLDLKLPKLGGLEVLRAIRSDPRTKLIPVVVMTSSKEEQDVIESYKLGANSYIVKPIEFESFALAVVRLGSYWLLLNHPPA